jgi:hypothetical protein
MKSREPKSLYWFVDLDKPNEYMAFLLYFWKRPKPIPYTCIGKLIKFKWENRKKYEKRLLWILEQLKNLHSSFAPQ